MTAARRANPPVLIGLAALLSSAGVAAAQQDNPVYVDDSPRAWELFRQAQDQAGDNVGEAVRLYQELLDDYGMKLLPLNEVTGDHFVAVRARVLTELAGDETLLERYRLAETAQAERFLESGQLLRLALTRPLTEPGLEALLRLAQEDLETANFYSALDWLRQAATHPDLKGRRAAHGWYMTGAAAAYLSDAETLTRAVVALGSLGKDGRRLRDRLDQLVMVERPEFIAGISSLDHARATEIDQLVAQPIWSLPLADTPLTRGLGEAAGAEQAIPRPADPQRRNGALLTAAPTVAGLRIYINEGRTVHAVERFTGRPVWPPHVEREPATSTDQGSRQVADLNVVAASGGTLVTITGHAYADANRSDRTVVCLDADTGRLRWSRRIDRLSPSDELDGLFPHGAPVIGEGMVYVLARKVSRQLLTSCYLIAMDLADGSLRWARHVASSGGIRSRFARPFSSPAYVDGDIAVATAIGAIARIDATTGQTRWLRRYNPPLSPYLADRRPWEISSPVVTPAGLVAIRPDHRRVVLLDWVTGDDGGSAAATARDSWNSPRYLLADGEIIYGVGSEIRAFSAAALERPLWTFPRRSPDDDRRTPYDGEAAELRGRVQVVDGGLIVPTVEALVFLEGETGRPLHRVELDAVGNPLAAGPQLILAAADHLLAYMPLERAEQMLRQRIAAAPEDPAPALALMRLGMRVRDLAMALEAADLAIGAINGAAPGTPTARARQELFDILLDLDREQVAETVEQGESLHAMIGVVARDPVQRVEHLLAYGDWLAAHSLVRAIEAYQAVLSSPVLAATPRRHEGLVRPAATWAALRVAALIEEHGPAVYRPQADFAAGRLARLQRREADPEALSALAGEFPFADSSIEAAEAAAERYLAEGDPRGALAALTSAYRLAPVQQRAGALLGEIAAAAEGAGWRTHARSVLEYALDIHGDLDMPAAPGSPEQTSAQAWLERLAHGDPQRLAKVGDSQGKAEQLPGSLVPAMPNAGSSIAPDRAIVYDPPQLAVLRGPDLEPAWSTVLGMIGEPYVLRFDDRGLLLWVDAPGDDPRAVMLDATDGSSVWVSKGLTPAGDEDRRQGGNNLLPRGVQFDPSEVLPLLGPDTLYVVRRAGSVIALDLADGSTHRWQRIKDPPLEQVHLAALSDLGLVLAGASRQEHGRQLDPRIVALDPETGQTLLEIDPLGAAPVRWVGIGPLGAVLYGNNNGIEAVDLLTGARCWAQVGPDTAATPRAWQARGRLIVESPVVRPADGSTPIRALRVADGVVSAAFDTPQRGEWDRLDLREIVVDRERLFARYGARIVRFSPGGNVLGADVVSDHRDYVWLLPTADRLLLVSQFKSEQVMVPGEARRRTQHVYRVYAVSENCRLLGEGMELPPLDERLEKAQVIDGWLLLSTGSETLAVAMPE